MIHDSAITTYVNPDRAPWALGSSLGAFVLTTDPRLSVARVPLPHTHGISDVVNLQAALDGLAVAAASNPAPFVIVRKNSGGNIGARPRLNFIEGPNVTLTLADDPPNAEVAVTVTASVAGTVAGGDLSGTYPNPTVSEVSNANAFIQLQEDFEALLAWVVQTFGEIPPMLEERFEKVNS